MLSLAKKAGLSALLIFTASASAVTYDGFADIANLQLNGGAIQYRSALRLTSALQYFQTGSAFHKTPLTISKFSTFFKFRITQKGGYIPETKIGGDGFVFVIQPTATTVIGDSGGHMGYGKIAGASVAVEFDTYQNTNSNDPKLPHLAIDVNGGTIHDGSLPVATEFPRFNNGRLWHAWIDYDGTTIAVRVSPSAVRPETALLKAKLDIPALLGNADHAYAGFTAATGGFWENHDILYWDYRENYQPVEVLGGVVDRMQTLTVSCENLSTGQLVKIPESQGRAWDCEKAGLIGNPGDESVITLKGKLK